MKLTVQIDFDGDQPSDEEGEAIRRAIADAIYRQRQNVGITPDDSDLLIDECFVTVEEL